MKLGLRYHASYRYEEPVRFSPHDVRLFPRTDRFSRVRRVEFKTTPAATIRYFRDIFDNTVASCFVSEPARELRIQFAVDLDLEQRNPFHFLLESDAVDLPCKYDPARRALLVPYLQPHSNARLNVPGWEEPTEAKPQGTVSALVALNRALHDYIGYERREEGAARSPEETLRARRGACRDVAVLLAEILRQVGLAARLASGYLRETDAETRRAEGSLHAWTEVFLPGAGWLGLDPTNGSFCNHNFICAAVGLTPSDITPISGSYYHKTKIPSEMTSGLELLHL